MRSLPINSLADFHQFVGQQLASRASSQMTPEVAVALWRAHQESIIAIQEGLADVDAGRTFPAGDVISEIRAELHDA